jgi:hypothetical protein
MNGRSIVQLQPVDELPENQLDCGTPTFLFAPIADLREMPAQRETQLPATGS